MSNEFFFLLLLLKISEKRKVKRKVGDTRRRKAEFYCDKKMLIKCYLNNEKRERSGESKNKNSVAGT